MTKQSLLATAAIPVPPDSNAEDSPVAPGSYDDDVLRGVREIARYRGETERRTHYLLERKMLPAYQIGSRWEMRKSTHAAFIANLEAA